MAMLATVKNLFISKKPEPIDKRELMIDEYHSLTDKINNLQSMYDVSGNDSLLDGIAMFSKQRKEIFEQLRSDKEKKTDIKFVFNDKKNFYVQDDNVIHYITKSSIPKKSKQKTINQSTDNHLQYVMYNDIIMDIIDIENVDWLKLDDRMKHYKYLLLMLTNDYTLYFKLTNDVALIDKENFNLESTSGFLFSLIINDIDFDIYDLIHVILFNIEFYQNRVKVESPPNEFREKLLQFSEPYMRKLLQLKVNIKG